MCQKYMNIRFFLLQKTKSHWHCLGDSIIWTPIPTTISLSVSLCFNEKRQCMVTKLYTRSRRKVTKSLGPDFISDMLLLCVLWVAHTSSGPALTQRQKPKIDRNNERKLRCVAAFPVYFVFPLCLTGACTKLTTNAGWKREPEREKK